VRLELEPDETLTRKWLANHVQGWWFASGTLWLTDHRLVFIPNRLPLVWSQKTWACDLSDIENVSIADRKLRPGAGWKRPLQVTHAGVADFFAVLDVEPVAALIRETLPPHGTHS
jgi:hypothetical protein